jgi:hypothetical protein
MAVTGGDRRARSQVGSRTGGVQVAATGHFCVCFANSANKGIEAPRARKWEEGYQLIRAKHPDPRGAGR